MMDLEGKYQGNISLPPRLQSPDVFDPSFVDDGNFVPIINTQKAFYDIQIADAEKCIRRLENRNDELLERYEDTGASIDSVDIATGDRIASLTKQISIEEEKIQETRQRMVAITKSREEAKEAHMRSVDAANEKYENNRVALTSAIKALNAKINTLEDYKQTRTDLREKLRVLDETMTRNEEEVMLRREELDRKFKIDREKLKNEMYSRLLALAGTFQLQISNAITIPVRRLMRENIVIKNELMQIVDETLNRKEIYSTMRSMETVRRDTMKSGKRDSTKHLITVKIQRCLINALKEMRSVMEERLANLNPSKQFGQEYYDMLADSVGAEFMIIEERTRKLEVLLHRENVKLYRAEHLRNQSEFRMKKYEEIVYDVKYAVACALKMTETGQDILNMSEVELISHLTNLIVRGQTDIGCHVAASSESIPRPEETYTRGDLGFEPEHIDFEDSRMRIEFDKAKSPEIVSVDIPTVSDVLQSTMSLQYNDTEFEKLRKKSISADESSEPSFTSTVTESTDESSDVREDISEDGATLDDEEMVDGNEESLSFESEEREDA